MKLFYISIISLVSCLILYSCKKDSFLDAKPDKALFVPTTLPDLQALLDCEEVMNGISNDNMGGPNPQLLIDGADNYYMPDETYIKLSPFSKNVYIWDKNDPYGGETSLLDWNYPYRSVFYANVVLDGIDKINRTDINAEAWDNVKGSALFYRSYDFYQLAQAFAPPYDANTASSKLGIPLRLTGDISEKSKRATLQATYDQIIKDLTASVKLLPINPLYKTRPSKYAAFALIARTYLTMQNYDLALVYADSCLQLYSKLMDFNALDRNSRYPIKLFNDEVILAGVTNIHPTELFYPYYNRVDSNLYVSYSNHDLRRTIFFLENENGSISFKGSYTGNGYPFMGITTDEIYLIRAECYAREGKVNAAMSDLNTLLKKRWKLGTFIPFTAIDKEDALKQILEERRKELIFKGLRWTDLRRLNLDPRFAKTLVRHVNGKKYILPPNDPRYTWSIPDVVLSFNPKMRQNDR